MLRGTFAFFFTLSLWADGPVFQTGQTTVYQRGDDGYYTKGIAHSFTRDDVHGTVTDAASGLMWQDNAISATMDWTTAKSQCDGLTLSGYTNWRLPTIEELTSITAKNISTPGPVIYSVFQNTKAASYHASTNLTALPIYAWYVNFYYGNDYANTKTILRYMRCVRETADYVPPVSSYVRDNSNETVYDSDTNLTWADDVNVSIVSKAWSDAINYCEALDFAGEQDWRLPNLNELYMIADHTAYNPAIDSTFHNSVASYFWSSTTNVSDTSNAWLVNFYSGYGYRYSKIGSNYVRCVRDGQIVSSATDIIMNDISEGVSVPLFGLPASAVLALLFSLGGFGFLRRKS